MISVGKGADEECMDGYILCVCISLKVARISIREKNVNMDKIFLLSVIQV